MNMKAQKMVERIMMNRTVGRKNHCRAGQRDRPQSPRRRRRCPHRADHPAQAIGGHGREDRADHGEPGEEEHPHGDAEDRPEDRVRHGVLDRDQDGDRKDDLADQRQCLRRVLAVQTVVVPADQGQRHQDADAADGADQPALEGVEPEAVLEVEVAQHRDGEQAESDGRKSDEDRLDRADAQDALERRLE
jgi:hypothetical protein